MTKIVVIEDEESVRENVLQILDSGSYEGIGAENGLEGLRVVRTELPDLVVCDIMLPEMDGYAVLETLRRSPSTKTIPVILLTAKSERDDMRRGMDLGADDYITKPFRRTELLQAISTRLQRRQAWLDQAERQLDELRSTINLALTHELRTPLAQILGFSELLSSETAMIRLVELADVGRAIHESALRLQRVFENYLTYAHIELLAASPQKLAALRSARCENAAGLVHDLAQSRAAAAGRLADLRLDLANVIIAMDSEHLAKLFSELLDNALKYSQAGTTIRVTLRAAGGHSQLTIIDEGGGMREADIASVGAFMQFGRTVYERPGLGLGLVIARRLAMLHGGDLTITSTVGVGTRVAVHIPTALDLEFQIDPGFSKG